MSGQITGIVNTRNAATTLDLCLRSLKDHVDELLVVDMESDDDTVGIAHSLGARVLSHRPLGYVEPARAFAIANASHDWILILDADEVLPATLGRRLREMADRGEADVVVIGWRNYLFGGPTDHGPFGPKVDRHRRFFRRSMLVHSSELHAPPEPLPDAREVVLPPVPELCVSHFAYVDLSDWIARSNRYTTIEAQSLVQAGATPPGNIAMFASAARIFFRSYVRQRGFRDGWRGFHSCLLLAQYRLATAMKAQQLHRVGSPEHIQRRYREAAERLIQQ